MKPVRKKLSQWLRYIDARDIFCLIGFVLLYAGLTHYGHHVAMIVLGGIILIKGLVKWV